MSAPVRRDASGHWLPGTSGNLTGRPMVVAEIRELARTHAPAALAKVVALIDHADARVAFAAAKEILDRVYDRLGRNYEDVCDAIREFMRRGVVIRAVINSFTFDGATKDPMQQAVRDALIGFMAATAQAQAEATKAAQRAGVEHAKANADAAYLGRKPSYTRQQLATVRELLGQEARGIAAIAKETGLSRQTIYRIKDDPGSAEAALAAWGM
jgi:putative DNA-invertase from lambdoid prophage Rac